MRVTINGAERELPDGTSVREAVSAVGVAADERGVAVALDLDVVPRAAWGETILKAGARLEVLRASAGG